MRVGQLLYNYKNKLRSNLKHLQKFDANGIIVHPCKLKINYSPWLLHSHKVLNSYFSHSTVLKFQWEPYSYFTSTETNLLEYLQQFDANGIIVHPCKLLIIVHDCYTLRKPLKAILAIVQFVKIPVRAIQLLYDYKNKLWSNLKHLQQFDANGIVLHPCKLLIIVHDCYTHRKP